jgi:hypothetical protein
MLKIDTLKTRRTKLKNNFEGLRDAYTANLPILEEEKKKFEIGVITNGMLRALATTLASALKISTPIIDLNLKCLRFYSAEVGDIGKSNKMLSIEEEGLADDGYYVTTIVVHDALIAARIFNSKDLVSRDLEKTHKNSVITWLYREEK